MVKKQAKEIKLKMHRDCFEDIKDALDIVIHRQEGQPEFIERCKLLMRIIEEVLDE